MAAIKVTFRSRSNGKRFIKTFKSKATAKRAIAGLRNTGKASVVKKNAFGASYVSTNYRARY